MLRLKKIEIIGFKSFADRTVLEFDVGITAIVGPNGCGKSNIADAFRWVLGEQSAKSMRGSKMPDVIFGGASQRKAVNICEVTITLTNVGGVLPIDYEEVSVTRRLHRSGESEYFINRHPSRLKDVQGLFIDSGMGRNAFSIFEQGKIDQVINLSPIERRSIFEDAAGIARFLMRKREALRKLEQTDLNIARVQDIHQEVEKQVELLEQQAYKARLFKDKRVLLEEWEKTVLFGKWKSSDKKWQDAQEKSQEYKLRLEEVNQQIDRWNQELHQAKIELEEREKALRSQSEELFKMRSAKEIKAKEIQSHADRLKEISAKEKSLKQELDDLLKKRETLQFEIKEHQGSQKALEKELADSGNVARKQREMTHRLESDVGKLREQQLKSQQERLKQVQAESQVENELNQTRLRLEHSEERIDQLQDKQKNLSQSTEALRKAAEEKKQQMQAVSQSVDDQRIILHKLEKNFKDLSLEIQKTQSDMEEIQREITEAKARQKVLMRLREEMQGFSASTKRLLQEAQNTKSPLFQKLQGLYELFSSEECQNVGIVAALRPYVQTLAVRTKADFDEVMAFARTHQLKDYSLICLEDLNNASKTKKNSEGLPSILDNGGSPLARHFLKYVFVADSTEHALSVAREIEGAEIWTKEETYIDRYRVVFHPLQGESNVFAREAELKALEKQIEGKEKTISRMDLNLKEIQNKKEGIQIQQTQADKEIRREEMKLVEVNFSLQRANADLEKVQKEKQQLESERKLIVETMEKLKHALHELELRYSQSKKKAADAQQQSIDTDAELEQRSGVLKSQQKELRESESAYQKLQDQNQKLTYALNLLEVKSQENLQHEKRIKQELTVCDNLQEKIAVQGTECELTLKEVDKALSEIGKGCRKVEEDVEKKKATIAALEKQGERIRGQVKQAETENYQLGIQLAQFAVSRQTAESELQERFHLTIEEASTLGLNLEKGIEYAERQMRSLRHDLEEMGDVNMTAIEECDQQKTRHAYLTQQIQDMALAKQELIKIITELDTESRKLFKETFEVIRFNFQKNFSILFNGGEADLQFTESQDILEAGIEIIAKPPGKQMRSISLMSGGEKCLTAMALLFAIFEVRPAPFCILDEIDAPLDDSNIERFVNVLKQFIDRCQFMIITHNKRTMAIADVLFGVSMEEKGVSKLLQFNFEKHSEPTLVEV